MSNLTMSDFVIGDAGDIMYTGSNPNSMTVHEFYRFLASTGFDAPEKNPQDLTEENAEEMFLERIGA